MSKQEMNCTECGHPLQYHKARKRITRIYLECPVDGCTCALRAKRTEEVLQGLFA